MAKRKVNENRLLESVFAAPTFGRAMGELKRLYTENRQELVEHLETAPLDRRAIVTVACDLLSLVMEAKGLPQGVGESVCDNVSGRVLGEYAGCERCDHYPCTCDQEVAT